MQVPRTSTPSPERDAQPLDVGSTPLWSLSELPPTHGALTSDLDTEVCVIGAGIAGLTTAYQCLQEGRKVVVLDQEVVGAGETMRTSAHLASALDDRFTYLERRHGRTGARLLAGSHAAAIDTIESLCAEHGIECGFERLYGYLYPAAAEGEGDAEFLSKECEAAVRAGLLAEIVEAPRFGFGENAPALRFAHQGACDIGAYLSGLARVVLQKGARIHTNSGVSEVVPGQRARVQLRTGQSVTAEHVVVATGMPITSTVSLPLKQAAYRSYVCAFRIPAGRIVRGLHWDDEDPYHYVRLAACSTPGHDFVLVGGEDHKTGQNDAPEECFARLTAWARKRYPFANEPSYQWSGQILEPMDGVGFVGRSPDLGDNIYVITGDSGNGLTLGTLGAKIVADAIAARANDWSQVYDPGRSMLPVLGTFISETTHVAAQYFDYLRPGDVDSLAQIAPGEGALLREGLSLHAVYRDENGEYHACSATCPHLGGVVHWNAVEKTWDCPCHGSRFDGFGRVITGPATCDMVEIELRGADRIRA